MNTKFIFLILFTYNFNQFCFSQVRINWSEDISYLKSYLEIVHPRLNDFVTEEKLNANFAYLLENWQQLSDVEVITRIVELMVKIQDGHTGVDFLHPDNEYIKGLFHYFPVWLYKFSDGIYAIYAKKDYHKVVGKKIVTIGNLPVEEAIIQLMRMNIGDNEIGKSQRFELIREFLQYTNVIGLDTENLTFSYEDEKNQIQKITIEPESTSTFYFAPKVFPQKDSVIVTMNDNANNELPLYLSKLSEGGFSGNNYWYTFLPEQNTLYLQINVNVNKDDDPFDAFCTRMFNDLDSLNAGKLIIDARLNGGGQHFEMPLIKGIIERPHIDRIGNLFLITGRRTISASEHLTTQMEKYTNVIIVGEPTAARPNMVGSLTPFYLPNSKLKCFTAKQYTQDSEYYDLRLTTKPQIYSLLSSADYANNLDPVMETIFTYDEIAKYKEKVGKAMKNGYEENGVTGLKKAFYDQKKVCLEYGINLEYFFMDEFSWWMYRNRKDKEDYSSFIKFVVDEIPESMRANYWYGRNCHLNNKLEKAIDYYKKTLELHPAHSNAQKYIKLIEMHRNFDVVNYGY